MIFCLSTECFAGAQGAVLIDGKNGRVLFEYNKDERLPMASTTKIMTALIALEQADIDEEFTVSTEAIKVEGSSMGLLPGDRATLRVLAAGMLMASGNDAANAAAVRVAGSISAFVELMNAKAAELGLSNTHFETPSGLDGDSHYSTAYDMAILAKAALDDPDFAAICGTADTKISYGNPPYQRWISNHNRLLRTLEGATGVKTGFTKKAGRCLVSSAEREGVSLILATLNCPDDWSYHTELYDKYFAELSSVELSGLVPKTEIPVSGGNAESVILSPCPVSAALFGGEYERVTVVLSTEPFLIAPVEHGAVAGKVYFYLDGVLIAETVLTAETSVLKKEYERGFWQKIKDFLNIKEQ